VAPKATEKHLVGLPLLVVGPTDIGRLIRELEAIDNSVLEAELRTKAPATQLPKFGQLLSATVELNKLDLLQATDRQQLAEFLALVRDKAPTIHMSFSAEPNEAFIEKLMAWLRREIHPVVLLTIGLQPSLGAGCIVRGINKQFDLSLRQDFLNKRELLMAKLAGTEQAVAEQPA